MSALFKTFCEHPVLLPLVFVLYLALSWVAMKIGFAVMILGLKLLTWLIPQLDVVARLIR